MNWPGWLHRIDINDGVEMARGVPGAVLLDVRTRQEYQERRIPGSVNLPLDELERVSEQISDMDTPVFVFCLSGGRSARAESTLKRMGYRSVTNIGGISGYLGTTEKGAAK